MHCAAPVLPTPTPKVGASVWDRHGRLITVDTTSRLALGLEVGLISRAKRAPIQRLLTEDGHPWVPAGTVPYLKPGIPLVTDRAVRWQKGAPWVWVTCRMLLLESDPERIHCLVNSIPAPAGVRQRGFTCAACDQPVMAVADYHGRELCMDCWVKTSTMRFRADEEKGLDLVRDV